MNRHELGDEIAARVIVNMPLEARTEIVLQKRPYSGVQIFYEHQGICYWAIGFSKVTWPDKWDADYGLEMAVKKAAHDIARQICEAGDAVAVTA